MNDNAFLSLQFVRTVVSALPGTSERLCFDTPAFYVKDKIIARLKEDGENFVLYTEERDKWMVANPVTFHITDHYVNYKFMLVKLDTVNPDHLKQLLITAWKTRAPKKLLKEWDNNY